MTNEERAAYQRLCVTRYELLCEVGDGEHADLTPEIVEAVRWITHALGCCEADVAELRMQLGGLRRTAANALLARADAAKADWRASVAIDHVLRHARGPV
jgi:hypothetical protein